MRKAEVLKTSRFLKTHDSEKSRTAPTSLFVEQYDDWRRCGWLGIDDSACQCQSKRMGRTKAIGRSGDYLFSKRNAIAEILANIVWFEV